MEEVDVDVVGPQPVELILEKPVEVRGFLHEPARHLGRELHLLAVTVPQGLADENLAVSPVVGIRGVHVVDPGVHRAVDHVDGKRLVDLLRRHEDGKSMQPNPSAEAFHLVLPKLL
jgi:hypothetical protein